MFMCTCMCVNASLKARFSCGYKLACEHVTTASSVRVCYQELSCFGGGRATAAHKTKQETTKHLALLASLGRLGLSEHMLLCGGGSAAAQDRAGARFSERLVPLSDTTLYGFTGLDGGLGAVVATRRDGQSTKEGA